MLLLFTVLFCWGALLGEARQGGRRAVSEFTINMDDPPQTRFSKVTNVFNTSIQAFYQEYFAHDWPLRELLYEIAEKRGPETPELQAEIEAVARSTGLPVWGVHAINLLYPLQTLMVPIENGSFSAYRGVRFPWAAPSCTGIIAVDRTDGVVYHARNQDFSPAEYMQNLVYTGVFTSGGKVLYRAQMLAGYSMPLTAIRMGPNGYAIETNTRYPDLGDGGNTAMFDNLFVKKRELNGWSVRQVLQTVSDYETAVSRLSAAPLVATEYQIISGVKKGIILARDPDSVAYSLVLGQKNFECRADYIIITNFDFFFHDIREWFDPTGGKIGRPRRIVAQRILNATTVLTPTVLFDTINTVGVIATDTIFQAMISVEKGLWNVSLPACDDC